MKYKNLFLFALMLTAAILLPACGGNSATVPAPTMISQVSPVESTILATATLAPEPTATPLPPTDTPAPEPTATPLPPTDTPAPEPTATPLPPIDTPAPEPTATPLPPTDTPAPEPTATPLPPIDTPALEPTATLLPIPAGQGALVMVNCRGDVLNIDILPGQLTVELAPKTAEICFTSPAIYLDPGSYVLEGSIAGVSSELDPSIATVPVVADQITEIRF